MTKNPIGGCTSRQGARLRAFLDRASAEAAAHQALRVYGAQNVPYLCDKCQLWHLCPAERHTPSHRCSACSKQAYETEQGATRRAALSSRERGVRLRVYPCPYGEGWHLTSSP